MKDTVKKKHTCHFTQVSNKICFDKRLTPASKGIFMYLWAKPDDWKVVVNDVVNNNNITEYSTRQALRELREFGYIKWEKYLISGRFAGMTYELDDTGELLSDIETQDVVSPSVVLPHTVDQHNNNIDITNKELTNTESNKKPNKKNDLEDFIQDLYQDYKKGINQKNSHYVCDTKQDGKMKQSAVNDCVKKLKKINKDDLLKIKTAINMFVRECNEGKTCMVKMNRFLSEKLQDYLPTIEEHGNNPYSLYLNDINKENVEVRCQEFANLIKEKLTDKSLEQKRGIYQQFVDKVLEIIPYDWSQVMLNVKTSPSKYFKLPSEDWFGD